MRMTFWEACRAILCLYSLLFSSWVIPKRLQTWQITQAYRTLFEELQNSFTQPE